MRKRRKLDKNNNGFFAYFLIILVLVFASFIWYALPDESLEFRDIFGRELDVSLSPVSGSNGEANLITWTNGTSSTGNLTFGSLLGKTQNDWNFDFIANFTNSSGQTINSANGNGACRIRYNETEVFTGFFDMTYNSGTLLWEHDSNFTHKDILGFQTNCTSDFGNVFLTGEFFVRNTPPFIPLAPIDLAAVEDTYSEHNLSQFVQEDDVNDVLSYSIVNITSTKFSDTEPDFYTWIDINPSTGDVIANATNDSHADSFDLTIQVLDNGNSGSNIGGVIKSVGLDIASVNDPPIFLNLINQSFNMTQLFEYVVIATDEENNFPFSFNISFLSCDTADWSDRNDINCDLFNESNYIVNDTAINISFTPVRNDVGSYIVNFSVTDNGSPNATESRVINFTVLNINTAPYFTYICDNERETLEDSAFSCEINATDIDEVNNLTFTSNETWFTFNESMNNVESVVVNALTDFNGSVLVNFTGTDTEVGNWSINLTAIDTGSPVRVNSTIFSFFVENVNDSVHLEDISDLIAFTSNNYTIMVNASDDDLLVYDKNVYDEILTFNSNTSWVNIASLGVVLNTNITEANISFDPNDGGTGMHVVNITVRDANNFSIDSDTFTINVIGNDPPSWQAETQTEHVLIEDTAFYLNLSLNVTDSNGDDINFSYTSTLDFASFSLDSDLGVIDFTPIDEDVGEHIVDITATDGISSDILTFNFTVVNLNDELFIEIPLLLENATLNSNSNITASEDNLTKISFFVQDDDFRIPLAQKNFYNETLLVGLNISGFNSNLFSFVRDSSFPTLSGVNANKSLYEAIFTPNKSDVGEYNVTLNITDFSGDSDIFDFNLTVIEVDHAPVLIGIENQTSAINMTLVLDINATDLEDGDETSGNLYFSYDFLPDGNTNDFINFDQNIFNSTSGLLNVTFNDSDGGSYHLNITVNDSSGLVTHGDFWIFVFDAPLIDYPNTGSVFNLAEGNQSNLTFNASHSISDSLDYEFYLNNVLKFSVNGVGNSTEFVWQFTPNFSDETYGEFGNLSLIVLNPALTNLNDSETWSVNITHENAPIIFNGLISDKQANFDQTIDLDLSVYFSDEDYTDINYNQSLNFTIASNATNSSGVGFTVSEDLILSLSASGTLFEIINISGSDLDGNDSITNATSNNFLVRFTEPTTESTPSPSSGGGGGSSSRTKPVALNILVPDPVSADQGEVLLLPITLVNDGGITLKDITLSSSVAKDGELRPDIAASFDKEFIEQLERNGGSEEVLLRIQTAANELGLYEITINADVDSPKYSDFGKVFIDVREGDSVVDRLVFTEELIASNPECVELTELVEESRGYLNQGNFELAGNKLEEAVNACSEAISQQSIFSTERIRDKLQDRVFIYLLIATIVSIVLGVSYYIYQRIMFQRAMRENLRKF